MPTNKPTPPTIPPTPTTSPELEQLRKENAELRALFGDALLLLRKIDAAYWQQNMTPLWVQPMKMLRARAQAMGVEE